MTYPLRKVATVSAVVALLAFLLALFVTSPDSDVVLQAGARAGICFTAVGLFWTFYEKYGWKLSPLRLGGWLSPYPDLSGRWEGTVQRDDETLPHPFVLEVRQSFTRVSFRTFSRNSSGGSEHAFLTMDESGSVFGLVAVWQTTTKRRDDPSKEETFRGTSVWSIAFIDKEGEIGDELAIIDRYYTSREPKTSGRVHVTRVGKRCRNVFA